MHDVTLPAIVGLTGGIASGKSTVTAMLRDHGVYVIDADQIARDVVAPGSQALAEIRQAFGPGVFAPHGALDRQALGAKIFGEEGARQTLNRITHPRIIQEMHARAQTAGRGGHDWVVYDAALLVENDAQLWLDALIVVALEQGEQLRRLMARDGISKPDAQAKISAQLPLAKKVAVADYIIDNGGSVEGTHEQVDELVKDIRTRFSASADAGA